MPSTNATRTVRTARFILFLASGLFALGVAVQMFLAGLALFIDSTRWTAHSNFASYIGLIPVLLLLLTFPARMPGKTKVKCILLIVLTIGIFITAMLSGKIGWISAAHPVMALGLFFNSILILRESRE